MDTLLVALRVVLSLAVVVGLLWYVQRRLTKGKRAPKRGSAVTVVGRQGIGSKASVVVVDLDGKRFLLGVTEHSVNVLHSGDQPVESDAPVTAIAKPVVARAAKPAASLKPTASVKPAASAKPAASVKPATSAKVDEDALILARAATFDSALKGSILSPSTWKQAGAAVRQQK